MPNSTAKRKNRTPVTREEGERRLIEATIDLIREEPFGEVSAREIARRADMNHGYVHVWFGSKAGLLHAAYVRHSERLAGKFVAGSLTLTAEALIDPDVELLFRMLGRLQNEPGGVELTRDNPRPMRDLIAWQLAQRANLTPEDAAMAAAFAVAAAAGVATVGPVLGLDVDSLAKAWPELVTAFAAGRAKG